MPDGILFPSAAAAGAHGVRAAAWRAAIDGRDVTREITQMALAVRYTDHVHGKADTVAIVVEDSEGRWRGDWYPTKGDALELWIGHAGSPLLPCGRFEIGEMEFTGPPSTVTIRGVAAGVRPTIRTRRSQAYEGQTLREIAEAVAARHQLRVVGDIEELRVDRMTQRDESDLTFLTRVAEAYGYVFSIRGEQLVFYAVAAIEAATTVATIRRADVKEYRLEDQAHRLYRACRVTYEDPTAKSTITGTATDADVVSEEVYTVTDFRAENVQQANVHAQATLRRLNRRETKGALTLPGDPRVAAGVTLQLGEDWGRLGGKFIAEESSHELTRHSGYVTTCEVKRVAA